MLLRKKEKIENWLNKFNIRNYDLIYDDEYGYIVNVNHNVYIANKKLKVIEIKFNEINGDFYCDDNQLESLEGCTKIVNGNFSCTYNKISSLKNFPKIIKRDVFINNNELKIEELKYLPVEIKTNYININGNKNLNNLQNLTNFNELKKQVEEILKIKEEKEKLLNVINENKLNINIKNSINKI